MNDYTLVVGVDQKHLNQLSLVWPTWKRHKPSLLQHPMVVIYDWRQISSADIRKVVDHPNLTTYPWPDRADIEYEGSSEDKWSNSQRYKMLAGFVHVPPVVVKTKYWLKLDTDVVATGKDDWIDDKWFQNEPAIVSHAWTFTKPPDQFVRLDEWVKSYSNMLPLLSSKLPLELVPTPGRDRLGHKRIISWCAFFNTEFTRQASSMAIKICGEGKLPVPSQDGYLWYCAKRMELGVLRPQMKTRGWQHWCTMYNIRQAAERALVNV